MVMEANEKGLVRTSTPTDATAANGAFAVPHDFGEVPQDFDYSAYGNVIVWATRDQRAQWSDTLLVLTGNAAVEVSVWATKRL